MIRLLKMGKDFYFYGHNAKISLIFAALFLVLGWLLSYGGAAGIFFLMTGPIWLIQTFFTLPVADLVKCSTKRKQIETSLAAVVGLIGELIVYVLFIVIVWVRSGNGYVEESRIAGFLIQAGYYAMITLVYCGTAYKFMVVSSIFYFIFALFVMNGFLYGYLDGVFVGIPFYAAVVIGFAEVLVGALLQWAFSKLLYKYPMTKHSQNRQISKLMK